MTVREQRHFMVATTEPTIAWLRLFVVALTGMALIAAGGTASPVSGAWVLILAAAVWASLNSVLSLYRRYRRLLTRRVYAISDLLLITALIFLTGGTASPMYLLYALPLVVIVLHHGVRSGLKYMVASTVLYALVASIPREEVSQSSPTVWLAHVGLLWTLYLLLGYMTHAEEGREEKARRRDELGALHRAAAAPTHTGDIPTVIESVLSGALGATNCSSAAIWLYEEEDDRFTTCYSLRQEERDSEVVQQPVSVSAGDVLYTVLYTGSAITVPDVMADNRMRNSALCTDRKRSAIIVPLVAPGAKRMGILSLGREECHRATQHELRFAGTLAIQAAVAIHSAFQFQEAATIEATREADKLRTQLLGTVSHELRTPIAAIQGFASSLRCADELEIPKEVEDDWLQEIESNADRLRRLVTDLLDLSRLEAGALRMAFEWQDMNDVVEDVRQNLEILAGTRTLVVQSRGTLPLVRCDAERIGQVLSNLVENAAKFSPADSNIVVGLERYDGGVRIGVLDEGEGIAPEYQDKVFERFYQVEGAAFRAQKGTGLGLAICRNIVEAHGGRIWVESSPQQGSIFYLTLPSPVPNAS